MPLPPTFRVRALPSIRPESLSSSFDDESSHIMEHGWPNKLYSDTETDKGLWGTECNHREPNLLNIASNQSHDEWTIAEAGPTYFPDKRRKIIRGTGSEARGSHNLEEENTIYSIQVLSSHAPCVHGEQNRKDWH
ncbi:hypothetical protein PCASD_16173 [Puccinia coronata f. sp. avenae]|uniref:Uncharacterized protein n=1 Tax=Puccinia coronata f. sp. avenae TaxID=200324 RepID=A0A2N5UBI0_9BASI|nr:hypothetical protein PCASD_16173 [Puccinia coronata f. sp. avenae]